MEMIQFPIFDYKGRNKKDWKLSDWFSLGPKFLCPLKIAKWGGIAKMIAGWF